VAGEKGGDKQNIYWQPGTARHEWIDQHRDHPVVAVFKGTGGHDGRYRTAKAHQQRDNRFAMKAYPVHGFVHDEYCTCHVTGIFHQ